MKIRFKTKDGLECIRECPDVEPPVTVVYSPMWKGFKNSPTSYIEYRKYEFNGETNDGIPTVYEA